jgi:hypothetical protein
MPLQVFIAPHAVPEGTGVSTGIPLLHEATSHTVPLVGVLLSSGTAVIPPEPSHTFFLQLPGVCVDTCVPLG